MTQETRRREAERRLREQRGEGVEDAPDLQTPRFSRGEETGPATLEKHHVGRFSEGLEAEPEEAGGKEHIGRFDQGQDAAGELVDDLHVGRFSEGLETEPHQHAGGHPAQ